MKFNEMKKIDEDLDMAEVAVKEFTKALMTSKIFKGLSKKEQEIVATAAAIAAF